MSLKGKVIWLTGASSGIGEALAYELSRKKVRMILSARRKEELERVKGNCHPLAQPEIRLLPFDLAEASNLQLITEAATHLFGHIDILINNGGVSQRSLAKDTQINVDRKIMEVDFFGTLSLTKYLLPHFIKRKSGHFVVVTSAMGIIGTPYRSGYAAAKHALHGFFDSLRAELWNESKDIFVTIVCPGWVHTHVSLNAMTGDGTKLNQMDPTTRAGIPPKVFARKMVRAIEKRKNEVYIGGFKEVMGIYVKRFFPNLFARIVRTAKVR